MYQNTVLEFLNMGGGEMMLIGVAILMLFGGKKLPELARGLGKGIREFKDASEGVKREIHRNINSVDEEHDKNDNFGNAQESHNERHHPTEEHPLTEPDSSQEKPLSSEELTSEDEAIKVENKSNEIHS